MSERNLAARIASQPVPVPTALALDRLAELEQGVAAAVAADLQLKPGAEALGVADVRALLLRVLIGSPYLTQLMQRDCGRLAEILATPPHAYLDRLRARLTAALDAATSQAAAMAALRRYKSAAALMIGLGDLGGALNVSEVTGMLTTAADTTVNAAVSHLFREAVAAGDWLAESGLPVAESSGYVVLAMGKHGAGELNYSSDVDLVVFYDADKARLRPKLEVQAFFVKLTRGLVRLMQERTADGYVFRVDLRLRPDPGATQVALSTAAAMNYYESFGQNWERAALIKARPIAGDLSVGTALLGELAPFIWRKYLDYAAIADIHAMKRQIHAHRGFAEIGVAGHNIKLGRGGIREIEFFTQTQQLIAGGRQADLRVSGTLEALRRLVARDWIKDSVRQELAEAYGFLRALEHRLQMVADEQTQTLPDDPGELAAFALFAGFTSFEALSEALTLRLRTVERHYAQLFEKMPELTTAGSNMVFAGEADDPQTVEKLALLGFSRPAQVLSMVRGWHHGRYPAVASPRARERLTEVQPLLIEALGATANPDAALAGFDRFLSLLPTGVQLFSLLRSNPRLLSIVATIMGSAPRLADSLSRRRRVIDALLDPRVMGGQPARADVERMIAEEFDQAVDLQGKLDAARVIGSEKQFLIGVRQLTGLIQPGQAAQSYSQLAECLIAAVQRAVEHDFARTNGSVPTGALAVIALGKLGGREMTAASDLDLIMVYDTAPGVDVSVGLKPLPPSVYYSRLIQRLISGLSSPTAEGRLYDVDMRLRPSGQKGPLATSFASFVEYQQDGAWLWEHMALTRARTVSGDADLCRRIEQTIQGVLIKPRDRAEVATAVRDMRQRIAAEKGTIRIWDLKQVRGGLVDIEFITQFLLLVEASSDPDVLDQNTIAALTRLEQSGRLDPGAARALIGTARLLNDLTQILRVTLDGAFDPATAPVGVTRLLAAVSGNPTFAHLEVELAERLDEVAALFDRIVKA